jgi:hypothetical protein
LQRRNGRGQFHDHLTIDELDERLTVYHDDDGWRRITLPKLQQLGARKVAEAVGISERRARDILKGRAMPHPRRRAEMEHLATLGSDDSRQASNTYARPARLASDGAPTMTVVPEIATESTNFQSPVCEALSSAVCLQPVAVLVNR